jgi:CDP-glucose 4,6-dehydratase
VGHVTTPTGSSLPDPDFWRGRRVLVTGHTGFKGAWLSAWLTSLGADLMGLSLPEAPTSPSLWELLDLQHIAELRSDLAGIGWEARVRDFSPHVIFHLGAQSLVPRGYLEPLETFRSNVLGTARILDTSTHLDSLEALVIATTDKVYDAEQPTPYAEEASLGGHDPYSASKACTELVVRSWPDSPRAVTARAGNVIGGGDWARDRLVPDVIRAWSIGATVDLRRPSAVRPWQHVLEPLRGYLLYAERVARQDSFHRALNFGPSSVQCVAVEDIVGRAADVWAQGTGEPPRWKPLAEPPIHETGVLELDSSRASVELGWRNVFGWEESITLTIQWHLKRRDGRTCRDLIADDLELYVTRCLVHK